MSSRYVRNLVEQWMTDPAMLVPYHASVNLDIDPPEDTWCTVEFSSSFRETLTFCQGAVEENGEIEVIYFGDAGAGYDTLIQALEADIKTLMAKRDTANKLILTGRSPPDEYFGGSAERHYGLSVFIEYIYYE
jgi:hypothetical protein